MFSSKSSAVKLSFTVIIGLVVLKVAVGIITGSLSTLAQAADSFLDLFAVAITFLAIRIATKPADEKHPFGHGKAENIAAVVQAIQIFVAGGSGTRLGIISGSPRPSVTKKAELPANWDKLVAKYKNVVPTYAMY